MHPPKAMFDTRVEMLNSDTNAYSCLCLSGMADSFSFKRCCSSFGDVLKKPAVGRSPPFRSLHFHVLIPFSQSIKILAAFGIFWSIFNVVLSFTQIKNSCSFSDPSGAPSACDQLGVKTLCNPSNSASDMAVYAISAKTIDGMPAGDLFCGWPIGLSANRLFAGFLNLVFSILHIISMANGRFLLAKTSAYETCIIFVAACAFKFFTFLFSHFVYLCFGAWWFANMCSDSNVSPLLQPTFRIPLTEGSPERHQGSKCLRHSKCFDFFRPANRNLPLCQSILHASPLRRCLLSLHDFCRCLMLAR
jgi:hypothetical protein